MEKTIEKLREQLQKQEKLASLGMLSAGIAHESQNPLNFVINFSKMNDKLLSDLEELVADNADKLPDDDREDLIDIMADLKENMAKIVEHGERAISIIRGILLVSRGKEGEFIPSNVNRIVKEYTWLSYHAMRANHKDFNVTIRESYQDDMPLARVIPQDLSRAVLNLVNNAFYAIWHKSQTADAAYKPEFSVSVSSQADSFTITFTDNGEGMTDEVKQRLFEHFFTTKPIGQGTGLGLGIVKDVVENRHHGTIAFSSEEGKGTTFTITIPFKK